MKTFQFFFLVICFLYCESANSKASSLPQESNPNTEKLFSTLLPEPQQLNIRADEQGIEPKNIIGYCLKKKAQIPFRQTTFPAIIFPSAQEGVIALELSRSIPQREGYSLTVSKGKISIQARTQAGLQYGVQTLAQIVQNATELSLPIPAFEITDYPGSNYRSIHIDLKHHLDKMDNMYRTLDRMAAYKLNAAIVEFEDKIRYESNPVIASPNAPTIAEWQKWAEYAHQLNIEISPLVQGIGHADFILKHKEFEHLRETPTSDWVCCPSNDDYYKVQFGLYDDAMKATPCGKYVHVGGDEVGERALGVCPKCKAKGLTALQHQMKWLRTVSDYIVAHGRIPIFWDDMVFKHTGLYEVILDTADPAKMDSIWQARLPELNSHISLFPKKVVYMRWQYGNANQKGNKMALKWYHDNGLQVMGATAAQTTYPMMPQANGSGRYIRTFQQAKKSTPIVGVFCTAWDDASPLSETFWKGFIAHAQYSWTTIDSLFNDEFDRRYRIREFGYIIAQLPDFRQQLESTFILWEEGLLDEGVRRAMWRTGGKYKIMSLPTEERGAWSKQYADRLEKSLKAMTKYVELQQLLLKYRASATRNDYALQVFEQINNLTAYTPKLLLAISRYDIERDVTSLRDLRYCMEEFAHIRKNLEEVFAQIRYIDQPQGYILPMNHHAHLAIRTANSDWMFLFEIDMLKKLGDYLPANSK